MTIAELFVNIGIKGDDKVSKSLKDTKTGISDITSSISAAKIAIAGMMYGLQKLMSNSAQTGMALNQFQTLTGISADTLQRWQYAARQAGVSGEEMAGAFKSVQTAMTNISLGKAPPEYLAQLGQKVGFDMNKAKDTVYVMQKLQEFAKVVPPNIANNMLKSFGLGEGTITAMQKGVFNQKNFAKADVYSGGEVTQLAKVDTAWSNLGNKIQMAMGHLTSKHGMELVKDMDKLVMSLIKVADALTIIGEKLKIFKAIGFIAQGVSDVFTKIAGDVTGISKGYDRDKKVADAGGPSIFKQMWLQGKANAEGKDYNALLKEEMGKSSATKPSDFIAPPMPRMGGKEEGKKVEHNMNQTVHIHGVKDSKDAAHEIKKQIHSAYRQLPGQAQGS